MCTTNSLTIDWNETWRQQLQDASFRNIGENWQKAAEKWDKSMRGTTQGTYFEQLLARLEITPNDTVLDVGCGNGALSIPLARRAQKVTALDLTPAMIEYTSRNVAAAGLNNVTTIVHDWTTVQVGLHVQPHDVVVASRALLMLNLRQFLINLDKAALRRSYITWSTGENSIDSRVAEALGETYRPQPAYHIVYNMLYDLGICADVQVYTIDDVRSFDTLEEGVSSLARTRTLNTETVARLVDIFKNEFQYHDGHYFRKMNGSCALISWGKGRPYHRPV